MNKEEVYVDELRALKDGHVGLVERYRRLQELMRRVCIEETAHSHAEYSGLFSRLYSVCQHRGIDYHAVDHARRNARLVLNHEAEPSEEGYRRDWAALCVWLSSLYAFPLPGDLVQAIAAAGKTGILTENPVTATGEHFRCIRLTVVGVDDSGLDVVSSDTPEGETLRVVCQSGNPILHQAEPGTQLNALDCVRHGRELYPSMLVLEPDFLLDVSRLAASVKPYGSHPFNYLLDQFAPRHATLPILLGEAANSFMDDCINGGTDAPAREAFVRSMQAHFHEHLLDYATLPDNVDASYFDKAYEHYCHIRQVVTADFTAPGNGLAADRLVLEPSFICEAMGLRGRLDVMTLDHRRVVELKSGRADDFGHNPRPQVPHALQMGLYKAILHYNFGLPYQDIHTYLFYSRYPVLYDERSSGDAIAAAMRLRNGIVCLERQLRRDGLAGVLDRLDVDTLNERKMNNRFFEEYLRPPLERMCDVLHRYAPDADGENALVGCYFNAFLAFLKREHYFAKIGDNRPDSTRGFARVWTAGVEAKRLSGDILTGLRLQAAEGDRGISRLVFSLPDYGPDFLPGFAEGEMVQLYAWNGPEDNVTNHQLFRGYIESLTDEVLIVQLTYAQRNAKVLPADSSYAVEHDSSDSVFVQAYRGLYQFLTAPDSRKRLLLGLRQPARDEDVTLCGHYANEAVASIVLSAKQARDYYLLVGPPGTGKTSVALRAMVEEFLLENAARPGRSLLLSAYTNRAVDEICQMLETLDPPTDYVRIGVEQTCAPQYRAHLLSQWAGGLTRREEVAASLRRVPVVVGTVATLSGNIGLLAFKRFEAVIVDEASQILEPHLLPLLCATADGEPLIGKFILIGDHKQLPAVVVQPERDTRVSDARLREVGLTDLSNSLFERLYGLLCGWGRTDSYGWLDCQGRMHPAISDYVNQLFYAGRLRPVPLPHQLGKLPFAQVGQGLSRAIAGVRLGFLPVRPDRPVANNKANAAEAEAVSALVEAIGRLYALNRLPFDAGRQVGIIVPFRNQIAMVRQALSRRGITDAGSITVDTVECYQGSQRDHIIFSTTISQPYQLDLLSAVQQVDGRPVDRKLNVAVTRARMQLIVVGNDLLLNRSPLYRELIRESEIINGHIY